MNKFYQLIFLLIFITFGVRSWAAPNFMVVEGQLIDPSGHVPIEGSSVGFLLQVFSPGPEECLLYEESHTVNMTNSNGFFAIDLGSGTQTGAGYEDTNTIASAFSNTTGAVNPSTCAAGATYTPASTHHRKLRITFDDGSGPITIGEDVLIGSNAYALSAGSVDGLTATELLQINFGAGYNLNQANLEFIFNSTNWTELQALLDGTSSSFSVGGAPTADVDNNNQKIINVADPDPATASDAVNVNYARSYIGGQQADTVSLAALAAGDNGQVLTWDGTQWTSQNVSDDSKLPLSGGTMTGVLNMGNQHITNVDDISATSLTLSGGLGVTSGVNSGGPLNLMNEMDLQLSENSANGSEYIALKAPANLTNNVTLTLPPNDGNSGDFLQTDGNGLLTWQPLTLGESNTASNSGTGAGIFSAKIGSNLGFKSLISTTSKLQITSTPDEVHFSVDENGFDPNLIPVSAPSLAATNLYDAINELASSKPSNGGNSWSSDMSLGTNDNYSVNFQTNGTNAMTINPIGNIGIGVDNPVSKLHIENGNIKQNNYASPSEMIFSRANGSHITPSPVSTGDFLGVVGFYGREGGGGYPPGAFMRARVEGTFSASISPTSLSFGTASTAGGLPQERMTLSSEGHLGLGTTNPFAQFEIRQPTGGPSQLIRVENDSSNEVFTLNNLGHIKTPGSIQIGAQGGSCSGLLDVGQLRSDPSYNSLQVCVDFGGSNFGWATVSDKRCPVGMAKIDDSTSNTHLCISSSPLTGTHDNATSACHGAFVGSKICSQNQMAQANVIATMNFTGGNIVSDIVYNGGYQAVVVDGSGRPDGPPVGVQATGQTFYCCID